MSRRDNESHVSNSKAASVAFRQNELQKAHIFFPPNITQVSQEVQDLKSYLLELPSSLRHAENEQDVDRALRHIGAPDNNLYSDALSKAQQIDTSVVQSCYLQHERVWMREVNEPMMSIFLHARRTGLLMTTEDYLWKEGREITRAQSPVSLDDPKPDIAVGLKPVRVGPSPIESWPTLSYNVLEELRQSPLISLIYSPSQRLDIVYPAVIYEAKSDSNPILWAENQSAIGAARALGLLEELARLSDSSAIPPVVVITSAGSSWQIHIASLASDGSINMVPISTKRYALEDFSERYALQVVLHRLYAWILGPFKNQIEEHIKILWGSFTDQKARQLGTV